SYPGFERLISLVGLDLSTDPLQSTRRALGEPPVSPAGILQTCISWLAGCIGAVDGWLCPIRVPRRSECGRVIAFFFRPLSAIRTKCSSLH
ncbi:hypothetical protein JG687_00016576, partial [Phytophthora cactorum]